MKVRYAAILLAVSVCACTSGKTDHSHTETDIRPVGEDQRVVPEQAILDRMESTSLVDLALVEGDGVRERAKRAQVYASELLFQSAEGRQFFRHMIGCALGADSTVTYAHEGIPYVQSGRLALAPEWQTRGLSPEEKALVAGCLVSQSAGRATRAPDAPSAQKRMDYDHRAFAFELLDLNNWASADEAFTTVDATADETAGSCWTSGPNYNRWFKFTAATNYIDINVLIGGTQGTMRYPLLAIWDAAGGELACARYTTASADLGLQLNNLTPGQEYYISVDHNDDPTLQGTFALSANDQQPNDYDYRASAFELTTLSNWDSADEAFTTVGATPDEVKGSCWNSGPHYNRWFRFTAVTNYIDIRLRVGGTAGTMRYPNMALWDGPGAELDCARFTTGTGHLDIQRNDLIPGQTYFISVDNTEDTYLRGTFALSVNDQLVLDYDYRSNAIDLVDLDNWTSADGEFTTQFATGDENQGNCWSTGPNYNRWFRFQATTNYISVTMRTGANEGTLRYPYLAIWDSAGTQLSCAKFLGPYDDLNLALGNLTPGEFYYVSVDNFTGNEFRGTFSLSVADEPVVDYDYRATALELTDRDKWNSENEVFTTVDATGDEMRASCWDSGPNFNRWFRFTALSQYMNITMRTGADEGTLKYPYLALWNAAGTEFGCKRFITSTGDLNLEVDTLTMGEDYYISVDNYEFTSFRGTFSMSLDMDYDNKVHAIELTDRDGWSSNPGDYSTEDGTPDGLKGSCWNNGPNHNRWFKFTAATEYIEIAVLTDGAEGTVQYPWLALWDSSDTEIGCIKFTPQENDIRLKRTDLIPGETYYFAVDNFIGGYEGDFTLTVTDQHPEDYDYREFAHELTNLNDYVSAPEEFTTAGATPDDVKGSCWNNGPNYNRWFKFTLSSNHLNVKVRTGGAEGTLQFPFLALWDELGNEIECRKFAVSDSDLQIHRNDLTPGATYYIAVDNFNNTTFPGTFSLSVSDVVPMDYDYRAFALELNDLNNWYSGDAAFSTIDGTRDEFRASCWNNGPNYNRWFTFTAVSPNIDITMHTGAPEGDVRYAYVALWDDLGNEVGCARFAGAFDDLNIMRNDLIPGERYYISVDNFGRQEYRGDFGLAVDGL